MLAEVETSRGNPEENDVKRSEKFLWFSVCVGCLLNVSTGAAAVWTSSTLPKLKEVGNEENPFGKPISLYEEALLGSLYPLCIYIGPFLFIRLADLIGRKWFLMSISCIEFSCFVILAVANNIYYFYVARVLQGLAAGCTVTVLSVYVAEIAETHNRGKFGTLCNLFQSLGNTYGYAVSVFQLKISTLLCLVPLAISIPIFAAFIPESPVYLVSKGRRTEAREAIRKFRNINFCEAGRVLIETDMLINESHQRNTNFLVFLQDFALRKALLMTIGVFTFLNFTGLFAVLGYLHTIFSLANIQISETISSISVGIVQCLSILISTYFIEKLGRKLLLLSSSAVVAVSLLLLGTYFQLKSSEFSYINEISWLPVFSVALLIIGYGIGFGPVSFVFMSEIFPPDYKTTGGALAILASSVPSFAVVYTFPVIRDFFGISWCFWILEILILLGFLFIYFCLVETRGKSFIEIQHILQGNTRQTEQTQEIIVLDIVAT